jgi:hypothetical protein
MQQESLEHVFQFLSYLFFIIHVIVILINFDYCSKISKNYDMINQYLSKEFHLLQLYFIFEALQRQENLFFH